MLAASVFGQLTVTGDALVALLLACVAVLVLLGLGIVYGVVRILRHPVRLVRSIMSVLLLQAALAIAIVVLPLLLHFQSSTDAFTDRLDRVLVASEAIRDSTLRAEQASLVADTRSAADTLRSLPERTSSAVGYALDRLQRDFGLYRIVLFEATGEPGPAAPPGTVVPPIDLLELERALAAPNDAVAVELATGGNLRLSRFQALDPEVVVRDDLRTRLVAMRVERLLPHEVGTEIGAIERARVEYHTSRALRDGERQSLVLLVIILVVVLMYATVNGTVYVGNRYSRRIELINRTMVEVAAQEVPSSTVPVSGDDEITEVSRSFNDMVDKIGTLVRKERRQSAQLEVIQATIDAGLLVLDDDLEIRTANLAASRLLGGSAATTMQASLAATPRPRLPALAERWPEIADFAGWVAANLSVAASGEVKVRERRLQVRIATARFQDPARPDEQRRAVVLFTDISQQLAGERQHAFSYTLHGINNPLQAAMVQAELALNKVGQVDDPALRDAIAGYVDKVVFQLKRIDDQARAWGKISGMVEPRCEALDLNAAVRDIVDHADLAAVTARLELATALPPVWFDANMLADMLENLIKNTIEQVAIKEIPAGRFRIVTSMAGGKVRLEFIDNAGGIDPDKLPLVFAAHKSFKPGGHGIGLHRIAESLKRVDGTITVRNCEETGSPGACFTVTLHRGDSPPAGLAN